MNWFGEDWGAPCCEPELHIETPVGAKCVWCSERIVNGDTGFTSVVYPTNQIIHYHENCYLRQILGSVAHIEGRCSCYGTGTESDPPDMTLRQAATAAVRAHHLVAIKDRLN
jgi:hypothetical protein